MALGARTANAAVFLGVSQDFFSWFQNSRKYAHEVRECNGRDLLDSYLVQTVRYDTNYELVGESRLFLLVGKTLTNPIPKCAPFCRFSGFRLLNESPVNRLLPCTWRQTVRIQDKPINRSSAAAPRRQQIIANNSYIAHLHSVLPGCAATLFALATKSGTLSVFRRPLLYTKYVYDVGKCA